VALLLAVTVFVLVGAPLYLLTAGKERDDRARNRRTQPEVRNQLPTSKHSPGTIIIEPTHMY
jgi:hypothetical protein